MSRLPCRLEHTPQVWERRLVAALVGGWTSAHHEFVGWQYRALVHGLRVQVDAEIMEDAAP